MATPLLELVMIVKDEAHGIIQTLESVKPHIDRWTILDTGSTDDTRDLIRQTLADLPGQLYEEPFIDFGTTRNRALDLAGTASTFSLMLSGDERIVGGAALKTFCEQARASPREAYYLEVKFGEDCYDSARLALTAAGWRYEGATHEVLVRAKGAQGVPGRRIPNVHVFHDVSHRDQTSAIKGWLRDFDLLTAARQKHPRDTRATFYLAQTLECLGDYQAARGMYQQRVDLGGWAEEIYEARYRIARCAKALDEPWHLVQQLYLDAHSHSPHRAEPLYQIARHWYGERQYALTYLFASRGSMIPYPTAATLFVERAIYDWKLHDLVGVAAYFIGEYAIGKAAAAKALASCPDDERLIRNLRFYDMPDARLAADETRDP